jgi:ornithine decarboxylase
VEALAGASVTILNKSLEDHLESLPGEAFEGPQFFMDFATVIRRVQFWKKHLPTVEPWYAVKCNPEPVLVRVLQSLGCSFDCASPAEMELVLSTGHSADRIIYAHPTKPISHLQAARRLGVRLMVFDNASELEKIARHFPEARLLIRLAACDDTSALCPMSIKFGARPDAARGLLERAQTLGLEVVGVHFHVGSGCTEAAAYRQALLTARRVFDEASELGMHFELLDIGGGYPGDEETAQVKFADIAKEVNALIPVLFPDTRVIAEPGRFIAMQSASLVTKIVSKAELPNNKIRYHINDGLYGSFNCVIYDHAALLEPVVLGKKCNRRSRTCVMFGPTCDGFDRVLENSDALPELDEGDLILWPHMGAYTSAAATNFNGFPSPKYNYVFSLEDHH